LQYTHDGKFSKTIEYGAGIETIKELKYGNDKTIMPITEYKHNNKGELITEIL